MEAKIVAEYFLSKDVDRKLFNSNVINLNNRKCYEGNVRLNKYLFLAQVVYLAKYNTKLFDDNFCAYDNGPVIEEIMRSYLIMSPKNKKTKLDSNIADFLDKIYMSLENATTEELVEITHEDPEWLKFKNNTYNAPVMNLEANIEEYKRRYKGLIKALNI